MADDAFWSIPPDRPIASQDAVHVWRVNLDAAAPILIDTANVLSSAECGRADRFHFVADRDRFVARRVWLRLVLSSYLGLRPESVLLQTTEFGKPFVESAQARDPIRFNLSHSSGRALLAVTLGREVGVDLERIRAELIRETVAESFFSPHELTALRFLPVEQQPEAFFNCWTRKEAYIKAKGLGLSLPLNSFDVTLRPGDPARLLATRPDAEEAGRWSMSSLNAYPGYAAAFVSEGEKWSLSCWTWQPKGATS